MAPHQGRVSIVVRTQGVRRFLLEQALRSLAAQTYRNLEVIVVEDGADTASALIADVGRERAGCFRHLPVETAGRSLAGNLGLEASSGEWLGFLDEDDLLLPDHVDRLLSAAPPGCELVFARAAPELCHGLALDRADRPRRLAAIGDVPFSRLNLWGSNRYAIQAALFRRSLFETRGGLCQTLNHLEDWDLWLRYTTDIEPMAIGEVTSIFRVPAEATIQAERRRRHIQARPAVLERHLDLEGEVRFLDVANLFERADRPHTFALGLRILLIAITDRLGLLRDWLRQTITRPMNAHR